MGLKEKIKSIFKGEDNDRIRDILTKLKEIKVFTDDDLIHLDKDILKDTVFFKDIEIKKLLCAKPGAKSLREKLEEIFVKVNASKISDIEKYFEANEVYTAEDLALYDLEKLEKEKLTFTDLDVNKIKNFIRKEFPDRFSEIVKLEDHNRVKDALMFNVSMKKKELEEERKSKELESLHKTKEQLLQERHDIQIKLADLMICQTKQKQSSSKKSTGLKALPATNQTMNQTVATGFATAMVIGEMVAAGLDIYSNVTRNAENESNKQFLEEKLLLVNRDFAKVEKSIANHMDGNACLTSSSTTLAIENNPE